MFYTLFELSILNKRIEWIQSRRKIFTIISRRMMAYLLCNLIIIITSPSWTISLSMNSIPNIISTYFNFYISFSISVQICQFKVRFCLDSQRTVVQIRKKNIYTICWLLFGWGKTSTLFSPTQYWSSLSQFFVLTFERVLSFCWDFIILLYIL